MIIHDYDADPESLVNLEAFYGKQKKLVDTCLILFSNAILRFLLDRYECSVIGSAGPGGNVYCFDCKGEKIAFYLSGIGSAVASEICYHVHWQTGAARFILFGSCGSLDREKTQGRFIIPTECYRGDGCSYYFAPASDYLPVRNADRVARVFDEIGTPYCVTVDFESIEQSPATVTIRDRDTMKQERIAVSDLADYFKKQFI